VRVLSVVLRRLCVDVERRRVQESLLEQVKHPILGLAKSFAGLDDFVEYRLERHRAGGGAKHAADCPLLLARILEEASEHGLVRTPGHARSLEPAPGARPSVGASA
jgi:hypothetical protein